MKDLLEIRSDIDRIDNEIVDLYEERMQLVTDVAEYKIATGKKVFDKDREQQKLDTLSAKAVDDFMKHGIRGLFEQIMSVSRKKQYQLLQRHGIKEEIHFTEIDHLKTDHMHAIYQGTEGAYSQQALKQFFGYQTESKGVASWREAMEMIAEGKADYAVLPIENSSAGIVSENYDLLLEYENYIVGEQIIKVEHSLLGMPDAEISDITDVYSHPQALSQCSHFLAEHSEWTTHEVSNTAVGAKKIKEEGKKSQAAIASKATAEIYGLKELQEGVNYSHTNATRFIIVAGQPVFVRGADKISICFEVPNESGSLYHAISHFIYNNLNMTKIESRPIAERTWESRFFVDFEGNFNDSAVQNALRGLKEEARNLRILGNY
ncbi:MAG: prephenate dehydratase [Lachnospiraceae bacterium]